MDRNSKIYTDYCNILREELKPAMGCTEPIALAYAAAKAREILGVLPERVKVQASGSIIKNVKSVFVPNTGHMKGIEAAVSAGIVAGNADKELEVLADVKDADIPKMKEYMQNTPISVEHMEMGHTFDILVTLEAGEHRSKVRITNTHTNIVFMQKDNEILLEKEITADDDQDQTDRSVICMSGIWAFANSFEIEDLKDLFDRQIEYNMNIAKEGLKNRYGASVGQVLLSMGDSVSTRAKAHAAAGSDARMNGCDLPVVINSGSGNQGITASVPVIIYAEEIGATKEQLYRALAISNLTTIHEKTPIGRLSAYCGAVSAGAGAGAGIAYLLGGSFEEVCNTVLNAIATVSGMVCDGAKASCAAKIAESIDAGILGYHMAKQDIVFLDGDGIVDHSIEGTIANVGRLAKDGMGQTNEKIIDIMINSK